MMHCACRAQTISVMGENLPPFAVLENGVLSGPNVDKVLKIMAAVDKPLNVTDIEILPWARAYKTLESSPNTALFSLARTPEREKRFKWVGPLCSVELGLLAKRSKKIRLDSTSDIKKYRLGSIRNSAPEELFRNHFNLSTTDLIRTTEGGQNIRQLDSDRIDIFAYSVPTFNYLSAKIGLNPDDYEVIHTLKKSDLYLAFHRETDDTLIDKLNTALKQLQEPPTMIISGHPNYPPFMWQSEGKIVGVGVDLAKYICKELGLKYEIRHSGPWERVQRMGHVGEIDLIVGIYSNDKRRSYLDYSEPYLSDPTCIATLKPPPFNYTKVSDLIGKTGITMHGESFGKKIDAYMAKHLTIERANNGRAIIKNLIDGRADYILWGHYPLLIDTMRLKLEEKIQVVAPPVVIENMHLALSKKSQFKSYLPHINQIIASLKKEGQLEKWLEINLQKFNIEKLYDEL